MHKKRQSCINIHAPMCANTVNYKNNIASDHIYPRYKIILLQLCDKFGPLDISELNLRDKSSVSDL